MAKKDLTGKRFGRLVVLCDDGTRDKHRNVMWKCQCDCGNIKHVRTSDLTCKKVISCGCLQKEVMKKLWQDEEFRQTMSDTMREVSSQLWQDEEYRQRQSNKMRELNEKQWQSEEYRQMKSELSSKTITKQWQDDDFRQMMSDKGREQMKEMWQDEEFRNRRSGENNPSWKGGITPIGNYLRGLEVVDNWRVRAFIEANDYCEITGKKTKSDNREVHHIKPFSEIVVEAHKLNNIEIKQIVADYSEEDLEILKDYIEEWHKDTTNAIVLHKDVHQYFHYVFMKGKGRESSVEDVEEFKQRYLNGEFDGLI